MSANNVTSGTLTFRSEDGTCTRDQHPEAQLDALSWAGCERTFTGQASGTLARRPVLDEVLSYLRAGDTLVVTKLTGSAGPCVTLGVPSTTPYRPNPSRSPTSTAYSLLSVCHSAWHRLLNLHHMGFRTLSRTRG